MWDPVGSRPRPSASLSLNSKQASPTVRDMSLGRYQLVERIAQGGMAEVFRARLPTTAGMDKLVCIKRILPHLSQNREFIRLFTQEAKIALGLSHAPELIVLDEPTNHLDLVSIECLEAALADCPAAMLLVSHDRPLLDRLICRGARWQIALRDKDQRRFVLR